jgi:hypothetical protein
MESAKCIVPASVRRRHYETDAKRVYKLTVADGYLPEYFANGILTHNCKFTAHGYEGSDSPDRAESMIWPMTELFPSMTTVRSEPEMYGTQYAGPQSWMG